MDSTMSLNNFFQRDPAKKQIITLLKNLPEKKKDLIKGHLFKSKNVDHFDLDLSRKTSPEVWKDVIKIYSTALQLKNLEQKKIAVFMLWEILSGLTERENDEDFVSRLVDQNGGICSGKYEWLSDVMEASVPCVMETSEALLNCLSNVEIDHLYRRLCAQILVQINEKKCIELLVKLVGDESVKPGIRIEYASYLGQIDKNNSSDVIHSCVKSIKNMQSDKLYDLLKLCLVHKIPEGKKWAYSAINARTNVGVATRILLNQVDDKSIQYLTDLANECFADIKKDQKLFGSSHQRTNLELLTTTLATSKDPRIIDLLIHFIQNSLALPTKGRQTGPNSYILIENHEKLHHIAENTIKIWKDTENKIAIESLNMQ